MSFDTLSEEEKEETQKEFVCPYSAEERWDLICTGQYGVFDIFSRGGNSIGYRGFRTGYGTTGVYDSYKRALEAALTEFAHLK